MSSAVRSRGNQQTVGRRMREKLWTLRFRFVRRLSYTKHAYRVLLELRPHRRTRLPRRSTDLVIDGFPRSGNTFAFAAFNLANARSKQVSHHLHSPGQIVWAIEHDIPVILLIRDPDDVVLSEAVRAGRNFDLPELFTWYRDFYTALLAYRDHVVVAPFADVIDDLAAIIQEVNDRFGADFALYHNSEERDREIFKILERSPRSTLKDDTDLWVGAPNEQRDALKARLEDRLDEPDVQPSRAQARRVYEKWVRVG